MCHLHFDFFTDCRLLESPADGTVIYSNSATTYQEVATFSCDTGYDRIGGATRTCLDDGMWGGASPICQIKGNKCQIIFYVKRIDFLQRKISCLYTKLALREASNKRETL